MYLYPIKPISIYIHTTLLSSNIRLFVNICLRPFLCYEGKSNRLGRALDLSYQVLDLASIQLAKEDLFFEIPEKLNFCYNYKEEEITSSQPHHHCCHFVICKLLNCITKLQYKAARYISVLQLITMDQELQKFIKKGMRQKSPQCNASNECVKSVKRISQIFCSNFVINCSNKQGSPNLVLLELFY